MLLLLFVRDVKRHQRADERTPVGARTTHVHRFLQVSSQMSLSSILLLIFLSADPKLSDMYTHLTLTCLHTQRHDVHAVFYFTSCCNTVILCNIVMCAAVRHMTGVIYLILSCMCSSIAIGPGGLYTGDERSASVSLLCTCYMCFFFFYHTC